MARKTGKILNRICYLAGLLMLFLISVHYQGYDEKRIVAGAAIILLLSVAANRRLEVDLEFLVLLGTMVLYGVIFQYYYQNTEYWQNWRFADAGWPLVLM